MVPLASWPRSLQVRTPKIYVGIICKTVEKKREVEGIRVSMSTHDVRWSVLSFKI